MALRRRGWAPTVEYVTEYCLMPGVEAPPAPVLPARFRDNPHDYIKELNHGRLPYQEGEVHAR